MRRQNFSRRRGGKDSISNVRIVDPDDGRDDIVCQRYLQQYKVSEGQIRVVCNETIELNPGATSIGSTYSFLTCVTSDDFVSMAQQYTEFRVRAIRYDVYDVQPNSPYCVNYWATYHQIGGVPPSAPADVADRPDSRSIAPGTGKVSLAWVAHSTPEMSFQSTASYNSLGGLVFNVTPSAAVTGTKYQVFCKFVVDFRGRK